ncbi:MAG: hypothetical protein LBE70_02195 [Nitrososphaerota archaeon]|nr:hypothetical protein [Nitrososphaerota archaeon]
MQDIVLNVIVKLLRILGAVAFIADNPRRKGKESKIESSSSRLKKELICC